MAYPPIPDDASYDDALEAREQLLEVVCDSFRQARALGRSRRRHAHAVAQFAFEGPSPLFLIDANISGAGKGLLAHATATIAAGRPFAVAAYTKDDDETRKTITSLAIEGERFVLFDNIGTTFGSPSLDAALTSTDWQGRLLSKNEYPRIPLLVNWFATGNNVMLAADTSRRVCHIRLESDHEKPEERSGFKHPNLLVSPMQERFIDEYLIDLNAKQTAIRAGYSPKTAASMASQLLDKPKLSEAIKEAKGARSKRTGVHADRIVEELARVGFSDMGDVLDFSGEKPFARAPELLQALMRLQKRLLHQVRRIELALQARIEVQPSQQPQVVAILLQRLCRSGHAGSHGIGVTKWRIGRRRALF